MRRLAAMKPRRPPWKIEVKTDSGPGEHVRAFLALAMPNAVLHQLAAVQEEMRERIDDVSWTRHDSMHLTLHFLGNVRAADLAAAEAALLRAVDGTTPFNLRVEGVGSFGNRVIWAGLAGDLDTLRQLVDRIRDGVARFGSNDEQREFSAHVTLGRARSHIRGLDTLLRSWRDHRFGEWRVEEVHFYRSELSPKGARHTVLARAPLR